MDSDYKFIIFISIEIIILLLIIAIKLISSWIEKRKIEQILVYIEKKSDDKEYSKRIKLCLQKLKESDNEVENKNGN